MSRIGKQPIPIPSGVEVKIGKEAVEVKGPKGELKTPCHPAVSYEIKDGAVTVSRVDDSQEARAQHGLRRTLLDNCVVGVSRGFDKVLEVVGVGYKVAVKGNVVEMALGFSHPVLIDLPKGISAKAEGAKLTLSGPDKEQLGELAATIRRLRKPEPYKGKGIKYENEYIRRKAGKSGKK